MSLFLLNFENLLKISNFILSKMKALESYNLNEEEEKKLILREYRSLLRALKLKLKKGDKP